MSEIYLGLRAFSFFALRARWLTPVLSDSTKRAYCDENHESAAGIAFAYFGWWLPGRIEGTYLVIWAQMFLRCAKNGARCRYDSARPNSLLWSIASLRTMVAGLTSFRCCLDENLRGAVVHTEARFKA